MKTTTIQSSWMTEYSYRLDTKPYVGGVLESKLLLRKLKKTVQLQTLTAGFNGGIYNGPKFSRTYVDSPEYGVPFVGSSAMLYADLSDLPLLSRKQAEGKFLRHLELKRGMTLISCAGTVGRMVYVRPEMEGMWSSQHTLKVVPNPEKIPSGYLYSYLSSKFGVPLVVSGTYGSIIQGLEPQHIADLPVPRLGDALEHEIHALVEDAAQSLTEHGKLLRRATSETLELANIQDLPRHVWGDDERRLGWSQAAIRSDTLRALNYDRRLADHFDRIRSGKYSQLGDLCDPDYFVATIVFSRVDCDAEHGIKLVGQREAFRIWPEGRTVARSSIEGLRLLVNPGATLIPSHGTFGEFELFCRAVYSTKRTSAYAFGGDFYRCVPLPGSIPPGYLFAFLRSEVAFRMLRSISAGSKQQYQHRSLMYELPIPRLDDAEENRIAALIDRAADQFDHALDCEEKARTILEEAISNAK